ncbi:MAG: polysaccharide biosynthesis protein [Flavobacteriales bacterium]
MLQLKKNTPRWVIIVLDVLIHLFALFFAYLIRFDLKADFSLIQNEWTILSKSLWFFILVKMLVFGLLQIHQGIVRYTSTDDFKRILLAEVISSLLFIIGGLVRFYAFDHYYLFPNSVLIMEFIFSTAFVISGRLLVKLLYLEYIKEKGTEIPLVIFGAGVSGLMTKRIIEKDTSSLQNILGFIDDNPNLKSKRMEGARVYQLEDLPMLKQKFDLHTVIIAVQNLSADRLQQIAEAAFELGIQIQRVPEAKSWTNGTFQVKQFTKININDLLGRAVIELNNPKVFELINQRVILVTGAAGSIGSGLANSIAALNPEKLILLDQAESPLFELEQALKNNFPNLNFELVIGDICDEKRMSKLFALFQPELVFHAAAYKHVPLMEDNPAEAVRNNIGGTLNIATLSAQFGVGKFVMVSTDKAVNPTNVMGATKRIAEMSVDLLNENNETAYITTRFGNVLGSNGSVIPTFEKQIAAGGPVTVTDERITRFFMTIPEACQLVLEAAAMGNGGEIFVFEMGQAVKIIDLAKKMILLNGKQPYKDIDIQITGLRPGEKLYEEVLASSENSLATHHPKILIAKTRQTTQEQANGISELLSIAEKQENEACVTLMKKLVPEYISNNSTYQKLDK